MLSEQTCSGLLAAAGEGGNVPRLADLLSWTARQLRRAGIEAADLEARLLLEHVLRLSRSGLILAGGQRVTPDDLARVTELLCRRLAREPLQYLTGRREFWSLDFLVSPSVLIPRPETEFLLHEVLAGQGDVPREGGVLDLCCGSGVIAVVLAKELISPRRIIGADISPAALALARVNARRLGVAARIDWLCADLCSAFAAAACWALVVANPPYISSDDLATLEPEVREFEPRLALDGGMDGLEIIRRLLVQAGPALLPGGMLYCEIGAEQERQVLEIANAQPVLADLFDEVVVSRDWAGRPRVLRARRKDNSVKHG